MISPPTDERLLNFEERVDRLMEVPTEVLTRGGFNLETLDIQKGNVIRPIGMSVSIALSRYGRHVLNLREISAKEAKAAWDRA